MSEDDRAAKAARAKALLKKRQQQKAANATAAPSTPGVATPPRTFSPAPSEPVAEGPVRDIGEVFSNTQDGSDTSWLSSLPRVASPPPPQLNNVSASLAATPPPPAQSAPQPSASNVKHLEDQITKLSKENETLTSEISRLQGYESAAQQAEASLEAERKRVQGLNESYDKLQKETEIALENERGTVSLLVSEKAHLTAELEKLEDYESKAQTLETLLEAERVKASDLEELRARLQVDVNELTRRGEQTRAKEKEVLDHNKELERQLQITSANAAESRKEAEDFQRRLRELEEQIQADDRAERLETSLKHTQDRADELEFQLTKVKQSHTSLKSEKDALTTKLQELTTKEPEWTTKVASLDAELATVRNELSKAEAERTALSEEKSKLQTLSETNQSTIKDLQDKLAQAASAVATTTRQMQHTQNELRTVLRRAEDAEATQKSLQAEGTNLMRSLDEMRPKIVELTGVKLDLSEKLDGLERSLRNRDATISQLENDLGEARDTLEQSEQVWKDKLAQQEKRHHDTQHGAADMQKAYNELQEELDTALASLRNLETQRTGHHQEASRRLEEIERLSTLSQSQSEELDTLKRELEARRMSHDEEQDFLERAQNEIEALRSELSTRDEEISQLREVVNTPLTPNAPRSLDEEMISSLRQQHALELSSATSQIRALEDRIFDKDTSIHTLQKQLGSLEEQISQLKSTATPQRPYSPTSRSSSYSNGHHNGVSHRPNLPSPLARTVFDQAMSAETMHKRKVSLSMLKARMDSEAMVPTSSSSSSLPGGTHSRALSPVLSEGSGSQSRPPSRPSSAAGLKRHRANHQPRRPQFMDESHVFWCHCCTGDLVIL